jgi:hypothetical protein
VAGLSRREQRALEPVDERLLSGQPKLTANVRVADAPEIFRMKRHDRAAFRARGRHGGDQAASGARRNKGEDAREFTGGEIRIVLWRRARPGLTLSSHRSRDHNLIN